MMRPWSIRGHICTAPEDMEDQQGSGFDAMQVSRLHDLFRTGEAYTQHTQAQRHTTPQHTRTPAQSAHTQQKRDRHNNIPRHSTHTHIERRMDLHNPKDLLEIILLNIFHLFWGDAGGVSGGIFVLFCRDLGSNALIKITY